MRIATLLIACAVLAGGLSGCVDDDGPSLYISGNLLPDEDCIIATENANVTRGVLNVEFNSGAYVFSPRYHNSLIQNASSSPPRPDPNGLTVDGAEVEILDSAGGVVDFGGLPNPFTIRSTTFVPSSMGTAPGEAPGVLEVVPPAYVQALESGFLPADPDARGQILVDIKPFGETLGHRSVAGRSFLWPIDLCRGRDCLYAQAEEGEELNCCLPGQDVACSNTFLPIVPP